MLYPETRQKSMDVVTKEDPDTWTEGVEVDSVVDGDVS